MIDSKNIDHAKVSLFLKNLSLAQKKINERKTAKEELSRQFKKVKDISLPKTKQPILERELKELQNKISNVVEAEKKLVTQQQRDFFMTKELERRINAFEQKINEFLSYRKERQIKVEALEKKIKKNVMTRTQRKNNLQQQIKKLEDKYNLIKKSKQYNPELLEKIEERINNLKQKL